MMPDASGFRHAGGADDDGRILQIVQLERMRDLPNVSEVLHAERIRFFAEKLVDVLVETLRMEAINLGRIDAQRAVDKDGHRRELLGLGQLVERVNDLL